MAKILITGAAGFIGYHLAAELLKSGNELVLCDNLRRGKMDAEFTSLISNPAVQFIETDLTKSDNLQKLPAAVDYIYHLAAVVGVRLVEQAPEEVLRINGLTVLNMCQYASQVRGLKRFLFSSTSEAYSGTLKHFEIPIPTPEEVPLCIEDVRSPRSSYALSKIYGEGVCFAYGRKHQLPVTIVRYHNVYGPRMGFVHVIPEMFLKVSAAEVIDVASANQTRAFCYIDDAVHGTILAATSESTQGEILHVGNAGEEISVKELVNRIAAVMGKRLQITEKPDAPGSPRRRCPQTAKLERLTGYKPKVALTEGLTLTYSWYAPRLSAPHE